MIVYILTYCYLFFLSLFELIFTKFKYYKLFGITAFLVLLFIAALRVNTGTDFHTYLKFWEHINLFDSSLEHWSHVEIGLQFFISILKIFTKSDFIYFSILAIVPLFLFYKAILDLKLNIFVSLFFYFTFFYFAYLFNGIGQSFTISFLLYSINYIVNKRFYHVLLISILATLIHTSGLSIIFLYFLINVRYSTIKSFIFSLILGFIFYKFHIVNYILEVLFSSKLDVYYSFFTEKTSIFQFVTKFGIYSLLFAFSLRINDKLYQGVFRAYAFGFFLFLTVLDQNMLATKIFMIFKPLEIIMISLLIQHSKNIFTKIALFFTFLIPYTYQFYININNPDFFYNFRF